MPSTQRYVFTYPAHYGPQARFFDSLSDLVSYVSGWCVDGQLEVLVVSQNEFRSSL